MLFYQVLYGLISVFDLFLPSFDLLRAGSLTVRPWHITYTHSLLLEGLLVHLVDQQVHILAHLFQLIPELFVFSLEKFLFLGIVSESLYELGRVSHLLKLGPRLLKGLLDKLVRVPLLYHFLVVLRHRVVRACLRNTC